MPCMMNARDSSAPLMAYTSLQTQCFSSESQRLRELIALKFRLLITLRSLFAPLLLPLQRVAVTGRWSLAASGSSPTSRSKPAL